MSIEEEIAELRSQIQAAEQEVMEHIAEGRPNLAAAWEEHIKNLEQRMRDMKDEQRRDQG